MVMKGTRVFFLPQWQDDGDEFVTFIAEENEDGGRLLVSCNAFGDDAIIHPAMVVWVEMLDLDRMTNERKGIK